MALPVGNAPAKPLRCSTNLLDKLAESCMRLNFLLLDCHYMTIISPVIASDKEFSQTHQTVECSLQLHAGILLLVKNYLLVTLLCCWFKHYRKQKFWGKSELLFVRKLLRRFKGLQRTEQERGQRIAKKLGAKVTIQFNIHAGNSSQAGKILGAQRRQYKLT